MILRYLLPFFALFRICLADVCGSHATLVEQDRFFLSQPYSVELELDFENYLQFFKNTARLLPLFKNGLENYTTPEKLESTEPWQKVDFDKNRNVILLKKLFPDTAKAFQACAEDGNELISFRNNATRSRLALAIKQLGLSFAPVKVIPLFESVFDPSFHYLDTPNKKSIEALTGGAVPYLIQNGSMAYYAANAETTTATPVSSTSASGRKKRGASATASGSAGNVSPTSPPSGRTLCFRQNNPWDRAENRPGWLSKVKQIFNAVGIIERLTSSFNKAKKIINNLDVKSSTSVKKIKIALPGAMKRIADFLQSFSDVSKWETLIPEDEKQFDNFLHDAQSIDNSLGARGQSMLQLKKEGQDFKLPLFDEPNWIENLGLDSSVHRILEPIFIKPLGLSKGSKTENEAKSIVAKANFGVFLLNEGITLYTVEPNIQKNEIIAARYVIASHTSPFATMEYPSLIDCQQRDRNDFKACRSINMPFVTNDHQQKMIDCAKALLNKDLSANVNRCPRSPAPSSPFAYRAQCDEASHVSTAILNSVSPVKVAVVCNGQEHSIKDFSQFPVKMETECEIQEIEGEVKKILLPQMQKDFLQNYFLENVVTPSPPTQSNMKWEEFQPHLVTAGIVIGTFVIMIILMLLIAMVLFPSLFARLKCRRKSYDLEAARTKEQADHSAFSIGLHREHREPLNFDPESTRISRAPSRRSLTPRNLADTKFKFPPYDANKLN